VRSGQLLPIPDGFYLMSPRKLAPLLSSPILSPAGKLRLLAERFVTRRPEAHDESVASFATRRLGRETFERLVQPLVAGIYTADPARLSMAATMPQFLELERSHGSLLRATLGRVRTAGPAVHASDQFRSDAQSASGARYGLFLAPRHGMASLVNALVQRLPAQAIYFHASVTKLSRDSAGQWRVDIAPPNPQSAIRNPQSPLPTSRFDAVILAVPTFVSAGLVASIDHELARELAAIEYAGCAVVSLGYRRAQIGHPLDGFGFVVPQIEGRRIIAASFASRKFPGRAPADGALIRVFIGGALQPELLDLDDDQLRRLAENELAELLQISGEPLVCDIARWPRSMPQYHVGHLDRVACIEVLAAKHGNLALAGNAFDGVGIPQCIASGERAAERIAKHFASS
jgi:oxygen-dependent protoporphyrinogen oxidase